MGLADDLWLGRAHSHRVRSATECAKSPRRGRSRCTGTTPHNPDHHPRPAGASRPSPRRGVKGGGTLGRRESWARRVRRNAHRIGERVLRHERSLPRTCTPLGGLRAPPYPPAGGGRRPACTGFPPEKRFVTIVSPVLPTPGGSRRTDH